MKKYLNIIAALFLAVVCSSCLERNLEELDTYDGKEITSIAGVYYRYYDSGIIDASGEQAVKQVSLSVSNTQIDVEAGTCSLDVAVPTNFPASEAGKVNARELVVIVNISTAAIIRPIDGAPAFGTPGDWSKPNRYLIKAADGGQQEWTVSLTLKQ